MSIPDSLLEEVRARADLVEIVSEHTRLRRSGKTFRGPCPLHGGEGPNFSVDPAREIFKCFVCGESGDVFSFVMKHLGMTFPEAIRWTAARVGIEIPEERRRDEPEEEPYADLYEANAFAAEWFRAQLIEPDTGREARDYLDGRGITPEVRERFGIGWAPERWAALADSARVHGLRRETLLELGLLKEPKDAGREPYDAFRGRIIFPILSLSGKVLGFGGRVVGRVDEHIPKYLNSPESPIYHKGETLFGLRWSRGPIRKERVALVVEGYVDYVSLAAHGVENVVAPLGTAMTTEQAELLARYAERVILLYDSDSAGLKATFRTGDELLRTGVEVLVATLPAGEDPDSIVRAGGSEALRRHLHDAVDLLERKIQILDRRSYFDSIAGQRRAVDALLPTVRATADQVLRGLYLKRISERTGVPVEVIENEAGAGVDPRRRGGEVLRREEPGRAADRRGAREEGRAAAMDSTVASASRLGPERNILLLMLRDERFIEKAAERLGPDDFRDPVWREIYAETLRVHAESPREDGASTIEALLRALEDSEAARTQELIGDPEGENLVHPDRYFEDAVREIEIRNGDIALLAELTDEIERSDEETADRLLREKYELRQTMQRKGEMVKMNPTRRGGASERADG